MPIHRVRKGADPAADLVAAVAAAEGRGEQVVQVIPWANEWIVVSSGGGLETRAAAKPQRKAPVKRAPAKGRKK